MSTLSGVAIRDLTEHYFMSCMHEVTFKSPLPHLGDEVYCPRCEKAVTIAAFMYKFRCFTCYYSRGCGNDRDEMKRQANRHLVRWPRHTVGLFDTKGFLIARLKGNVPESLFAGIAAED